MAETRAPDQPPGTGRLAGVDPREMAESDVIVIWGTNAVSTQVNVMTHATRARKERGAKIVAGSASLEGETCSAAAPVEQQIVKRSKVVLKKNATVFTNAVVLPGVTVGEGCSVGAQSLVKADLEPWGMYAGCPVRRIRERAPDGEGSGVRTFVTAAQRPARVTPSHVPPPSSSRPASTWGASCQNAAPRVGRA